MILKGRPRAHGQQLADYLLSSKNEQVRVLDVRGTIADGRSPDGLKQSLKEMDELGKMTKAKSSLFHLAINPSDHDRMTPEDWKYSVAKAEKALGLEGQPRAVVSHIYEGKEHLHVVWSRVDVEQRKCVELSFTHLKLGKAAREIELELGLKQTPARARGAHRLKQHVADLQQHQDVRSATPREKLNATIEKAWHQSKTGEEFKAQIESAGYQLAIGRRGVLVMDTNNETYSISRCVEGIKAKDVKAKLGGLRDLPTVEDVRQPKIRKTETEDIKTTTVSARRQAQQITERSAREILPVEIEDAGTHENHPAGMTRRQGENLITDDMQQKLTAANDNRPDNSRYKRLPKETDEKYWSRVERANERAKQNAQKLQPHLKPKGPSRSY